MSRGLSVCWALGLLNEATLPKVRQQQYAGPNRRIDVLPTLWSGMDPQALPPDEGTGDYKVSLEHPMAIISLEKMHELYRKLQRERDILKAQLLDVQESVDAMSITIKLLEDQRNASKS